jgi:hypothetical protein
MQYLDASRPHSASGRAQWRDSFIVISSPDFRPSRPGFWFVHTINGARGNNAEIELPSEAIGQFLARWAEDPEDALSHYFGFEAPKGLGPSERRGERASERHDTVRTPALVLS